MRCAVLLLGVLAGGNRTSTASPAARERASVTGPTVSVTGEGACGGERRVQG